MPYESYNIYKSILKTLPKDVFRDVRSEMIKSEITISPNYRVVSIDGINVDVRFIRDDKDSTKAEILTSPDATINIGSLVVDGGNIWLAIDVVSDIASKGILRLCNNTLTLQTGATETLKGYDSVGRPVYELTPVYTSWNCVATSKIENPYDNLNSQINLPEGKMEVVIPYVNNTAIADNAEFIMWGYNYKIIGIDMSRVINDTGIIKLVAQRVVRS
ncbi:MAG: hypothetical protein GX660_01170 [Clostridiaceae bacterium]|nr:hypothetical protein [Clostridiaceae bacterium]